MSIPTDFWRAVETLHDVVYFTPATKERYGALGLKGYWMGYFASRAGALGEVSADVVRATFHGFAPSMVARAVPDCWAFADRSSVLDARTALGGETLAAALGDHDVVALAASLEPVLAGVDGAGKPLAAAQFGVPVPADPAAALWRHASVLREFRGDVHVALLVAAGLDGCAANALQVAVGRGPAEQRLMRGWTEEEWASSLSALASRGLVDSGSGAATPEGIAFRDRLEADTDTRCEAFLSADAAAVAGGATPALLAAARAVATSGVIPYPNPVGVPAP